MWSKRGCAVFVLAYSKLLTNGKTPPRNKPLVQWYIVQSPFHTAHWIWVMPCCLCEHHRGVIGCDGSGSSNSAKSTVCMNG